MKNKKKEVSSVVDKKELKAVKTLSNTDTKGTKDNVNDIEFWGNGDTFQLISKASSKAEGWMKSTKAMEIPWVGCVIQVTTQQGDNIAEALTFVEGTRIEKELENKTGKILSRKIVSSGK